ncbi:MULTISPECIES: GAF domain-containing sensor histidine kinase [unclassified Tolypothrix]|uniref:GAF domain-containing sensor histidine kinase n=1 Tax=unclassified Tolypothrix TaxID=2649714 RepID=UPI0005EAC343|nr:MULTISPECIES: ATP-binding protein [unclassified Tolypothrix]BAY94057.1 two-component sensor histidine kinase [Microchaete diplosiphon NIES-3275]EKF03619.1 sensor histidine kinase [Tolypothrix sp. PCC 7601]MBE9081837.1 GAF domain-containing sensor histidine kinase [Tolypothrix sp. LEGE 11397]UYD27825.1 GAF domain-containing sensor histidine kinase [Tolypothrix sp. PCC 7712]UYD36310.1 GAF domain-containing sensor histidine kinase [Tolypothrix sp. PCC 7601]
MTPINFRKLVTQKEFLAILNHLEREMGTTICIEDIKGTALIGIKSDASLSRYPVLLLEEVIGWVVGDQKAASIATLISYLAQQQSEKKSLTKELLEKYQEIDLFQDLSTQVTASLDVQEIARLVIEEARQCIPSSCGAILWLDDKTSWLKILWEYGELSSWSEPLKLGQGIIGTILRSPKGEIVNNVLADPRFVEMEPKVSSLICVPLLSKKQLTGAIVMCNQTPTTYSTKDWKLLSILALQAAGAIEKALLYEQSCNAAQVAQEQAQQLQLTLFELQQTQRKLIQSEKMSSLGNLVAEVAHDMNNPINYVSGNLSHIQQSTQEILDLLQLYQHHYPKPVPEIQTVIENLDLEFLIEDLTKMLSSMIVGVGRMRQLALTLRNFSRLDQAKMKPVDIHEGIESTLLILQGRFKPRERNLGIQIIKEYGDIPLVEGYANQLNQVFMNLIANAIDALEESMISCPWPPMGVKTPENYQIRISTEIVNSNCLKIQISDNGPGIPENIQERLFEPFFTTKPIGKGTGLGLSISHQIIEKHGGLLRCISQMGMGTTFSIEIPVLHNYDFSTD